MDLKNLKAILKLCRSQGVDKIVYEGITVEFGDMPYQIKGGERVAIPEEEEAPVMPTDEELAFYSAAPDPLEERLKGQQ